MSAIHRRISALECARARTEQGKNGPASFVETIRQMLQNIDGQHDLDRRPDETLQDEMVRRMQSVDGCNLALMPGDTLKEKHANIEPAYYGKIAVSAEARHAARVWLQLYDYV